MEINVGKTDQIIRFIIGIVLLVIGGFLFINNPNDILIPIILGILALISLFTAITRSCLLYKPFNINTSSK